MTVEIISGSSNEGKVVVKGNVKTIKDSQELKNKIESVTKNHQKITIELLDSFSLTSSITGYLTKKKQADNIDITMVVHNPQLYELLDMIALTDLFNVKKMI